MWAIEQQLWMVWRLKGKKYLKVELNIRLATFRKRQTNSLDFVIGSLLASGSYQTTVGLVRKAFLKLLSFKTFGLGFR